MLQKTCSFFSVAQDAVESGYRRYVRVTKPMRRFSKALQLVEINDKAVKATQLVHEVA